MFNQEVQQQIEAGEYMIHVFVDAVHQLDFPSAYNEPQNIVAIVNVPQLNITQQMTEKKIRPKEMFEWRDHAFIKTNEASQEALQDSVIEVQILKKGGKPDGSNLLVGLYEFSLEEIYQMKTPKHTLLNQWVALTDNSSSSKKSHEITGYLKVSI